MALVKYTLKDFVNITFDGFDYKLPDETIHLISNLSLQVGSPSYVKTPVFQKRDLTAKPEFTKEPNSAFKKKKNNKNMEIINDDDWEALRSFQTTKIEQKNGVEAQVDVIRSYLNKMTDKNYLDIKNKIVEIIEVITKDNNNMEEISSVGTTIFDIASTNRFYSKIYADLYSDLINKYDVMREVFEDSFNKYMELFDTIEYVDSIVDYDKFCKINKENEKRKALSAFFVNLMVNNIITKDKIIQLLKNLLIQIQQFIGEENKKNEVDEITENVAILFKRELFLESDYINEKIDNLNLIEVIEKLASSKSKSYLSLTNKSIFKFMDMIEM
jgi:hypothetical protein